MGPTSPLAGALGLADRCQQLADPARTVFLEQDIARIIAENDILCAGFQHDASSSALGFATECQTSASSSDRCAVIGETACREEPVNNKDKCQEQSLQQQRLWPPTESSRDLASCGGGGVQYSPVALPFPTSSTGNSCSQLGSGGGHDAMSTSPAVVSTRSSGAVAATARGAAVDGRPSAATRRGSARSSIAAEVEMLEGLTLELQSVFGSSDK
mmetsp:Transcript_104932/g.301705  ORF Transcript_104932/g.301705 Transcript_104932/m.301705 type:complete len:214 (+) Transcript_104932:122-763(+)